MSNKTTDANTDSVTTIDTIEPEIEQSESLPNLKDSKRLEFYERQFQAMYYVIAILLIMIIIAGYYSYIREGALGM